MRLCLYDDVCVYMQAVVSSGGGDVKAILEEAGYDSVEEVQEEIKDLQSVCKSASGGKKANAKRDLDEVLEVLAQCKAAIKSSGGAAPQKQVQDMYVLHMNVGMYLLLFVHLLISIGIMIRVLVLLLVKYNRGYW